MVSEGSSFGEAPRTAQSLALPSGAHRRLNLLTRDWVLVSPQRYARPWLGQREPAAASPRQDYDAACYLCPGNRRASGEVNPRYTGTYWFNNDYPAMTPATGVAASESQGPLRFEPAAGECRVLCFSPRHSASLADLSEDELGAVVNAWSWQVQDLGERYRWVQVFENRGEAMGSSNPHPHGQVWASAALPTEAAREDRAQFDHLAGQGTCLLCEYSGAEQRLGEREVLRTAGWVALVPFWACWPYEILVLPLRHTAHLTGLTGDERADLAELVGRLTRRLDGLFGTPFPYSMGWHGAPTGPGVAPARHWHLHAHLYPPLLRSATIRKFMVGYELLAEAQRDLTPETAAEHLRAVPDIWRTQGM
jgi:UDPglucose--hexose-1-phosphate uridylyltransferase